MGVVKTKNSDRQPVLKRLVERVKKTIPPFRTADLQRELTELSQRIDRLNKRISLLDNKERSETATDGTG